MSIRAEFNSFKPFVAIMRNGRQKKLCKRCANLPLCKLCANSKTNLDSVQTLCKRLGAEKVCRLIKTLVIES